MSLEVVDATPFASGLPSSLTLVEAACVRRAVSQVKPGDPSWIFVDGCRVISAYLVWYGIIGSGMQAQLWPGNPGFDGFNRRIQRLMLEFLRGKSAFYSENPDMQRSARAFLALGKATAEEMGHTLGAPGYFGPDTMIEDTAILMMEDWSDLKEARKIYDLLVMETAGAA